MDRGAGYLGRVPDGSAGDGALRVHVATVVRVTVFFSTIRTCVTEGVTQGLHCNGDQSFVVVVVCTNNYLTIVKDNETHTYTPFSAKVYVVQDNNKDRRWSPVVYDSGR